MENLGLYLLTVVISLSFALHLSPAMASPTAAPDPVTSNFIKASCRSTRYPALCLRCLSSYANKIQPDQRQLAQAALSVTLHRAEAAWVFLAKATRISGIKPKEYAALRDCVENIGGAVDQLKRSLQELDDVGKLAGEDFTWHMSNVQTWVSAALTNQHTCMDGFGGADTEGKIKTSVNARVVVVSQVTSNALALVNRFALRHRGSSGSP